MSEAMRLEKGETVPLKSGFFPRKLIEHTYERGAFCKGGANAWEDNTSLWYMFRKRKMDEDLEGEADRIIQDCVYPWLSDLFRETVLCIPIRRSATCGLWHDGPSRPI